MFALLVVAVLFFGAQGAPDVKDVIDKSYSAEYHNVTTSDGYILGVQRIPHGKCSDQSTSARKVVLLFHGLVAGSNCFTYLGPDYGIAYSLADAGYDVWLGNARGNSYSRHHVSLDPDKDSKKFFDFTYQEIALYDLPAMIDYILKITKQKKINYVAHAQGGTVFFVLNSHTDAYHSKFGSVHMLSAVGYEKHFPNKKVKLLASAIDVAYQVAQLVGYVEVKPDSPVTSIFAALLLNTKTPSELLSGASFKQAVHYFQNFRDEAFRKFDYGSIKNLVKYGRLSPPSYDLSKVNVELTLHYTESDPILSVEDTLAMAKDLPKAKTRIVPKKDFSHIDFVTNKEVKSLVTDYIIEAIKKS